MAMSEFQCYQFKAIDRTLTKGEREQVGSWSSRAQVTANSATFVYHYGDFRQSVHDAVAQYFDVMIYFANWGTRQLLLRLPAQLIDAGAIEQFCLENTWSADCINLEKRGDYYLLDIFFSDEEGDGWWMEEDDFDIDNLGQIREALFQGDYRALYLIWAKFALMIDAESEEIPPPPAVPANMNNLTPALEALIDFFEISQDLVAAAQSVSSDTKKTKIDYGQLLDQLPKEELVQWLQRLLEGEINLQVLLTRHLEQMLPNKEIAPSKALLPAELQELINKEERNRLDKEAVEAEAAYIKKMKTFEKEETAMWDSVFHNISRATGKSYDLATETLIDLKSLADYQHKEEKFGANMQELYEKYRKRNALIRRWENEGLVKVRG